MDRSSGRLRACFWATTFQADVYAFARHLALSGRWDVLVALDDPTGWRAQEIERLMPFPALLADRGDPSAVARFAPQLLVVDNHLPRQRLAPSILVLWHGFGWRVDDLVAMRRELRRLVGPVERENPRFLWQAFGDWDRDYRIRHSRIAPENVAVLGSAYSDLLLPGSPFRQEIERRIASAPQREADRRQTVLLAPTWHHGGILGHWGDDFDLLGRLFAHLHARGARAVLRLHDRHRYDPAYLSRLEALANSTGSVALKFKSDHPDSLIDLLTSDILISNYSSILNHYYVTGRPSIHIDPFDAAAGHTVRTWGRSGIKVRRGAAEGDLWKLPCSEIGGLRASDFDGLIACIDQALDDPHCCQKAADRFVARYWFGSDGQACERIERAVTARFF